MDKPSKAAYSDAARLLGSLGGKIGMSKLTPEQRAERGRAGGKARAAKLSQVQRSAIAKKAVMAREKKRRAQKGKS